MGDDFVGAVFAACDMPAEGRRAAAFDRRNYLQLAEADVAGVGLAPRRGRGRYPRQTSAGSDDPAGSCVPDDVW
jgi:hypothetical protein